MTEKIVNQGDKGVLLLGSGLKRELRALWHASQLDDVVPNCSIGSWQGGRLLWTPRIMSSLSWADCKVFQRKMVCLSLLLQKLDPVFNTWHSKYNFDPVDFLTGKKSL